MTLKMISIVTRSLTIHLRIKLQELNKVQMYFGSVVMIIIATSRHHKIHQWRVIIIVEMVVTLGPPQPPLHH